MLSFSDSTVIVIVFIIGFFKGTHKQSIFRKAREEKNRRSLKIFNPSQPNQSNDYKKNEAFHVGAKPPSMFHESYICLFHIFLNQVWQMRFDSCPYHFNLEVVTKCQFMTSLLMTPRKRVLIFLKFHNESYVIGKALT